MSSVAVLGFRKYYPTNERSDPLRSEPQSTPNNPKVVFMVRVQKDDEQNEISTIKNRRTWGNVNQGGKGWGKEKNETSPAGEIFPTPTSDVSDQLI